MPKRKLTDRFCKTVPPRQQTTIYWDTTRPGLGLKVTPTGHRSWKVIYRFGGRLRWYHLDNFPSVGLAEAREAARIIRAKAALGGDPQAEKIGGRAGITFREAADRYIEYIKKRNKSWKQAQRYIESELKPVWGARKADAITPDDVRALFAHITNRGAPASANLAVAHAGAFFAWAKKERLVKSNPVAEAAIERNPIAARDRVFNEDEIRRLWTAFGALPPAAEAAFRVLLLTAQRGGEVRQMERSEVDSEWWTIPGHKVKNGKAHRVPLTEPVLAILETLPGDGQYPFRSGPRDIPLGGLDAFAKTVRDESGVSDFRPHDLRRTAASMMTGMGISRLVVSKILNHAEAGITKVYDRHSYDSEKREALEAWARRLDAIVTGKTAKVVHLARKTS